MKYLLLILSFSILLSAEMEVDGDLKVVGNVQVGTIDSLEQLISLQQQQILTLQGLIVQLQAQIALLESQMALVGGDLGYADCFGIVGGDAVIDECGVCGGSGIAEGECDCDGNALDVCGICGGYITYQYDCPPMDIDGNIYEMIEIGTQAWFAENLKVTHYRNGDEIQTDLNNSSWSNPSSTGAFAYYEEDINNMTIYGNLYNWYAVDDDRGICPDGWHVPSENEWITLEINIGMSAGEASSFGWRGDEGGKLKTIGIEYWVSPNEGATNETGFSALPGGYRSDNGVYDYINYNSQFWSSSQQNNQNAWYRSVVHNKTEILRYYNDKPHGYSVRCLKD